MHTREQIESLCQQLSIPTSTAWHEPTFTALETQAVLPEGCLVQKTITGSVAEQIVLWTGVGNFSVTRAQRKAASRHLGVPTSRDHTLNPHDIDAVTFYGMQPGMVSPFLVSGTPATQELAGLFVLDWTQTHSAESTVAISLSLTESLIMPLEYLRALCEAYAAEVYAHLPIFTLF